MSLSRRIAARYLQARTTRQHDYLKALMDAMETPLRSAVSAFISWKPQPIPEATASALASAAREVVPHLKLVFEDTSRQEKAKTYLNRIKNLAKMISEWAASPTTQALTGVLKKQDTKAKNPWEKYREYRDEVLGMIRFFDTEVETVLLVEGFNVALMTSARDEWDEEKISKARWVLERASKILVRAGLGKFAHGKILAYPSATVPGEGRGTLAFYNKVSHIMALAVGGDPQKVLKTLVHEYGHKVYYEGLGNRARLSWIDFFEASQGAPDVDGIIRAWETTIAQSSKYEIQQYGRWAAYYLPWVIETDPEMGMWTNIVLDKLRIIEDINPMTGIPKKGTVAGLDQLIARKGEAKVFLYPVSAYSATSPSELFAEVFAFYLKKGPLAVPEIVRDQFQRAVPILKSAADKYGPSQALTKALDKKITYRVKSDTSGILLTVYAGNKRIGRIVAYEEQITPKMRCKEDSLRLLDVYPEVEDTRLPRSIDPSGGEHPRIRILSIYLADIVEEQYRGLGIGQAMYRALAAEWFDRTGPFLMMPDSCKGSGSTTADARRVWARLVQDFPSSGTVIAVLKRPVLSRQMQI